MTDITPPTRRAMRFLFWITLSGLLIWIGYAWHYGLLPSQWSPWLRYGFVQFFVGCWTSGSVGFAPRAKFFPFLILSSGALAAIFAYLAIFPVPASWSLIAGGDLNLDFASGSALFTAISVTIILFAPKIVFSNISKERALVMMAAFVLLIAVIEHVWSIFGPVGSQRTHRLENFLFVGTYGFVGWFCYYWREVTGFRRREAVDYGAMAASTLNDYPRVSWSQTVATDETEESADSKKRFALYLGLIAVAATYGAFSGGFDGALVWTLGTAWVGAFGLRGAGTPRAQGAQIIVTPHAPTNSERAEAVTPVTRVENCVAFIKEHGGELMFCIERGDEKRGTMTLSEVVPWASFQNFEEGTHRQWFRRKGTPDELSDWGVIVAQSSLPRIVCVAQSVDDHASLIELLVMLQRSFTGPVRDKALVEFAEAKREASHVTPIGAPSGAKVPSGF